MTKPERIILVLGIAIFLAGLGIYLAFLGPSHLLKVGGKTYSDSTDKTIDSGRRILDGVARRVSKAFNLTPTQQINGRIIVESSVPILELATLSQELTASSTHTQTWLYSSKVVEVQNGYRVKAGFNINRSFTLNYETDGKRLLVRLPPPEIL
ncbi:MAG: hypothetical protein SGI71_03485, partial [Verrucomicrobiota bacterium]|nr:hypothetical protein [Verrucomicrobiota bacterium]